MREERECTRGKNMMGHSLMEERMCVCKGGERRREKERVESVRGKRVCMSGERI